MRNCRQDKAGICFGAQEHRKPWKTGDEGQTGTGGMVQFLGGKHDSVCNWESKLKGGCQCMRLNQQSPRMPAQSNGAVRSDPELRSQKGWMSFSYSMVPCRLYSLESGKDRARGTVSKSLQGKIDCWPKMGAGAIQKSRQGVKIQGGNGHRLTD